jgi:hypothetical protein
MEPGNPADIWPAIERSGWAKAFDVTLRSLLEDPQVDAVQAHAYVRGDTLEQCPQAFRAAKDSTKPVAVWLSGDPQIFRRFRELVEPYGCAVYGEISRGARALRLLAGRRGGPLAGPGKTPLG